MAESLFTSQTPVSGNINDGTTYTLGTVWTPAVDGTVTHLRMFAPTSAPAGPVVGVLYRLDSDTTGVELSRATFGALALGGWNTVELPSAVSVSAGSYYVACYITPDRFVLTLDMFTTSAVVNGNLTAPQSGVPYGNGRLHVGDGFPEITSGDRACYFADVVFEVGAGPSPAQGSADFGVDLAVAAEGGRDSAGDADLAVAFTVAAQGSAPDISPAAGSVGLAVTLAVAAHGRAPGSAGGGGFPLGETAVIVRAQLADDGYGNNVRDWSTATRTDSPGWGFAPRPGDENTTDRSQGVIVGLTGYNTSPDVDLLPTDRMEVRGQVYEVVGEVGVWRSPFTGWEPGVEVALQRVYIAEG